MAGWSSGRRVFGPLLNGFNRAQRHHDHLPPVGVEAHGRGLIHEADRVEALVQCFDEQLAVDEDSDLRPGGLHIGRRHAQPGGGIAVFAE